MARKAKPKAWVRSAVKLLNDSSHPLRGRDLCAPQLEQTVGLGFQLALRHDGCSESDFRCIRSYNRKRRKRLYRCIII